MKDTKTLKKMVKHSTEKGLAKLALAYATGKGVRLTREEVDAIYGMDDAMHTRLNNEYEAMIEKEAAKGGGDTARSEAAKETQ